MNSLGRVNGVVKQNECNLCEKKESIMSEMPLDIVRKIFDFAESTPPMNTIKRSWGESKIFTPGAKEYLPEELVAFEIGKYLKTEDMKNFLSVNNSSMKYKKDSDIAKRFQVAHLLQKAKNLTAILPKRMDFSYLEKNIALLQAMYSKMDCKETVEQIKNPFRKVQTLIELAKIDCSYLTEAKKALQQITDSVEKAEMLIEIAKLDASYVEEAKQAVEQAECIPQIKAQMELDIAKLDPKSVVADYVITATKSAQQIRDPAAKSKQLLEIAKRDPNRDLTAVKEAVQQVTNSRTKAQILLDIAKIDPNCVIADYLAEVKKIAEEVADLFTKSQILLMIVKLDSTNPIVVEDYVTTTKNFVKLYEQAAKEAENSYEKDQYLETAEENESQLLLDLLKLGLSHDLTAAEKIQGTQQKIEALIAIANFYLMNKS